MFKSAAPKNPPAQTTTAQTLSEIYPAWRVLSDKLLDLSLREDALLERLREITERQDLENALRGQGRPAHLNGQPPADTTIPPRPLPPLSKMARDFLGEHAPPLEPKPLTDKERTAARVVKYTLPGDEEAAAIGSKLRAITEAKGMLHPLLERAHAVGSGLVCDARREDYRAVAAGICAALVALGDAVLAHRAFTQELVDQGAMWHSLKPVDVETITQVLGSPNDRDSTLRRILSWAADAGHFDTKTLPPSWAPPALKPAAPEYGRRKRLVGVLKKAGDGSGHRFVIEERRVTPHGDTVAPGGSPNAESPATVVADNAGG